MLLVVAGLILRGRMGLDKVLGLHLRLTRARQGAGKQAETLVARYRLPCLLEASWPSSLLQQLMPLHPPLDAFLQDSLLGPLDKRRTREASA